MIDNDNIKLFVQNTLGCGCPEEVFRSIGFKYNVLLGNEVVLKSVITIGNRLLIYVLEAAPQDFIEEKLAFLVSSGKKDRDLKGLNRLRLVIAADELLDRRMLQSQFDGLAGKDDKIHLHIIGKENTIFKERE
jgi:hypothetical protein